jgi:hypothetical protein
MTTLLMSCDMPITHSGHIHPFDNSLLLRIRLYKEWQHCWRRQREQSVCLYIYFGSRNVCSVLSIYDPLESQKSFPLSRKPDCRTPPHLIYIDFIGVTGEEYPEARSPLSYTGGDNLTCINIYIFFDGTSSCSRRGPLVPSCESSRSEVRWASRRAPTRSPTQC